METAWTFWAIAAALTLAVGGLMALALLRRGAAGEVERSDVALYRAQVQEVDRDVARGVISDEEAERLRLEISRRLLAADASAETRAPERDGPAMASGFTAALVTFGTLAGALGLYLWIGAPGAPDQPLTARLELAEERRAERPSQALFEAQLPPFAPPLEADPSYLELIERLRSAVAENPGELEGQVLLARNEARMGNYRAAHRAQAMVLQIKGVEATPEDLGTYIDLLVLGAEGYVSPEAEAVADQLLLQAPGNGPARYYKGLAHLQAGRPDLAYQVWNALLGESRIEDRWVPLVMGQMENVARAAGIRWQPPQIASALPGPSAEDVAAASELSEEDRNAMIQSMVDGLSSRLAREGGPPEDWSRLIRSLGVLGERERAAAIWAEAQVAFADFPGAVDQIRLAAEQAGVAP
jgi:cytochrome c-type biogenesis protein CcmH